MNNNRGKITVKIMPGTFQNDLHNKKGLYIFQIKNCISNNNIKLYNVTEIIYSCNYTYVYYLYTNCVCKTFTPQ